MPLKIILRLILAFLFATFAVIFSDLIPSVEGLNRIALRALLTILAGLVGFLVFPDLASKLSGYTGNLFNFIIGRLTNEILNQLFRLPRFGDSGLHPFSRPSNPVSTFKPLILDTSAIIDGRVLDIAKTGFINGIIYIPNFVLIELQQVADSADALKRARGRRGFDIINELKRVKGLKVEVWDKEIVGKSVDERLLKLAKSLQGKIITTDFNLNKLSEVHGVIVLNVNDLANAVKTLAVPGEEVEIKVVHIGKNPKQGVGYLEDGTMIVVEEGAKLIGQNIKVEISRVLQGSAGRMFFGKES